MNSNISCPFSLIFWELNGVQTIDTTDQHLSDSPSRSTTNSSGSIYSQKQSSDTALHQTDAQLKKLYTPTYIQSISSQSSIVSTIGPTLQWEDTSITYETTLSST